MAMASDLEKTLASLRRACKPGLWSSGVNLVRAGAVTVESRSPEEVVLRVRAQGRVVPAQAVIYPDQDEWDCDCGGRVRPCEHLAAAAIALAQAEGEGSGGVLMMFCEDDADDTVVPRLMAAGANLERITRVKVTAAATQLTKDSTEAERELAFDTDLALLRKILAENPKIKLVTVDPFSSYVGETININNEKEVRRALIPVAALSGETGVTFILNMHFNKRSDVSALHKFMGAVANTGVGRAAWVFAEDADSEDPENPKFLMVQAKVNVGRRQKGLEYTIASRDVPLPDGGTTNVGVIKWGEATDKTADAALGSFGAFGDESGTKVKAAGEWLGDFLRGGDQTVDAIKAAMPRNIGWRTLKTAKKVLGVVSNHVGDHWEWHLPANPPTKPEGDLDLVLHPCL